MADQQKNTTNKQLVDKDTQLKNINDKLLKDTQKDKGMGKTFWILAGLCAAAVIFIVTVVIVRNV